MKDSQLFKSHNAFVRALSLVLLSFVFYGTTVEAAHTHAKKARSENVAGVFNVSVPVNETESNLNLLGCGECLICQLHQHFSTSEISVPPTLGPTSLTSRFLKFNTVSVHSHTSTPRTGRAPPFTF